MKDDLLTTGQAAAACQISENQFRRIVEKKGIEPAAYYPNPHYRSGPRCPLYGRQVIGRLKRTSDVKRARARKKPDPEAARERRLNHLRKKFSRPADVIPAACAALFELNRYAKWSKCSRAHRDDIYDLKNEFLRLLYCAGFCDRVGLHAVPTPEKECYGCDGTGLHWSGEDCERCDGTGVFENAGELRFIVFSFSVSGTRYTWHQPEYLVDWEFSITDPATNAGWEPDGREKPVDMQPRAFAAAKDLIRFAISIGETGSLCITAVGCDAS
jgi:hypothetical protein